MAFRCPNTPRLCLFFTEALEKQRQMYERQMQQLRYQLMSPGTPSMPFLPMDMSKLTPTGSQSGIQRKYQQWAQERFVNLNFQNFIPKYL